MMPMPMTADKAMKLLLEDGYKNVYLSEIPEKAHAIITIKSGRLRKPSINLTTEFWKTTSAAMRVEFIRIISIFGINITIWKIENIQQFHRFKLKNSKK